MRVSRDPRGHVTSAAGALDTQPTAVSRHTDVTAMLADLKAKGAEYQALVRTVLRRARVRGLRCAVADVRGCVRSCMPPQLRARARACSLSHHVLQVLERKRAFEYVDELSKRYNSKVRVPAGPGCRARLRAAIRRWRRRRRAGYRVHICC